MIAIEFHGAAGTVTGSKTLITVNDSQLLVDCGVFQGTRELRQKNWEPVPFEARRLSAVIVTHCHIDHIGYLPRLVTAGFKGPVFATPPTIPLAQIMLLDTARIQEEDADFRNRKGLTRYERALPLFTEDDARLTFPLFRSVVFNRWVAVNDDIRFRFHIAGHILGAASVEIEVRDGDRRRTILMSGDVGRYAVPMVRDPYRPPQPDYLVCESTYGGEIHPPQDLFFSFAELIDEVHRNKNLLLIPAFAVGRTQQITYMINVLMQQKRIKPIGVHVDSPMAVRVSDVYRRFPSYHDIHQESLKRGRNVFYGKTTKLYRKRKSSKTLNRLRGPAVIISASGMLTGGRILHHLLNRLGDRKTILLLAGFMAEGTLGRKLHDGASQVYIHKQPVPVAAKVMSFRGLSGHADSYELNHWLEPVSTPPRTTFLIHGEPERSAALAEQLSRQRHWPTRVPKLHERFELE